MITIEEGVTGFFKVDGIDYQCNHYTLEYDNIAGGDEVRNFSLRNIHTGNKIITSRGYAEITGVASWSELIELLNYVGALSNNDVSVQDQSTPLIIASFSKQDVSSVLLVDGVLNEVTITAASIVGFQAGQYLSIFNVDANRFYLGNVIDINGNIITLDTPLDFAYPSGSFITGGQKNMNVDGSVSPVIFGVRNTEEQIGSEFDITRIIIHCETDSAIDLSKFGDIAGGILNGIVMRKVDGVQRNVFNAKTNGELKSLMYDFDVESASNPNQGQDGFTGRMTFGGQSKMGVVIRLKQGEDLQLLVRDDLTSLDLFEIVCEGHLVEY